MREGSLTPICTSWVTATIKENAYRVHLHNGNGAHDGMLPSWSAIR